MRRGKFNIHCAYHNQLRRGSCVLTSHGTLDVHCDFCQNLSMQKNSQPLPPPPTCCEFVRRIPDGDALERDVCARCGHIHYVNPKIVVGAVCSWHGRILLCRRAIEPRRGFWTIPAGYMEERETPAEGAAREALEEANVKIEIDRLLAV